MKRDVYESAVLSETAIGLISFGHGRVCGCCLADIRLGVWWVFTGCPYLGSHGWRRASVDEVARALEATP